MIQERESRRHRGLKVFVLLCAVMTIALPAMAAKGGHSSAGGSGGSCAVSPSSVASGGDLTVSGKAGHTGDWVNVYIYYSDGYWNFAGGSVSGGGSYSLNTKAQETQTSFWGPFYPAPTGTAKVEVYAGSANRNYGVVNSCTFTVT
jgi:hypothetical protein